RRVLMVLLLAALGGLCGLKTAVAEERIVVIGDSITDGNTYPMLVRQAIEASDAKQPAPVCINAGIAGDTARGMRDRLERDVFVHRPTRITLSVGINDVLRKVPVADFEADVRLIGERIRLRNIPTVIFTTTILGKKHFEADKRLEEFNAVLRLVAKEFGFSVA